MNNDTITAIISHNFQPNKLCLLPRFSTSSNFNKFIICLSQRNKEIIFIYSIYHKQYISTFLASFVNPLIISPYLSQIGYFSHYKPYDCINETKRQECIILNGNIFKNIDEMRRWLIIWHMLGTNRGISKTIKYYIANGYIQILAIIRSSILKQSYPKRDKYLQLLDEQ